MKREVRDFFQKRLFFVHFLHLLCVMPARRKYEISTYLENYGMYHMYETSIIIKILMQLL